MPQLRDFTQRQIAHSVRNFFGEEAAVFGRSPEIDDFLLQPHQQEQTMPERGGQPLIDADEKVLEVDRLVLALGQGAELNAGQPTG